jgi:acyl carrier protein
MDTMEPLLNGVVPASRETMDRIRRVFVESLQLNVRAQDLPYEQKLDEVVGLDSLAILEFVTAVEKEFGVTIEPEWLRIDFLRNLPQLAAYIEDRTHCPPGSTD